MTSALHRGTLASDIDQLLMLPTNVLSTLTSAAPIASRGETTIPPASQAIAEYSTSTATPNQSQGLIRSYIKSMREEVLGLDDGESDRLGGRLDVLREKGASIAEALGDVNVTAP